MILHKINFYLVVSYFNTIRSMRKTESKRLKTCILIVKKLNAKINAGNLNKRFTQQLSLSVNLN